MFHLQPWKAASTRFYGLCASLAMANPIEQCANLFTLPFALVFCPLNVEIEESAIYGLKDFGSAIATARNREVVKAFGGVLNGLDGNFGPV